MRTLLFGALIGLMAIWSPIGAAAQVVRHEGKPVLLFFDWDSAAVTSEYARSLDRIAQDVAAGRTVRVVIAGHADRAGNAAQALTMSRRRAEAVRAYLLAQGVPERSMTVEAFGESRPLVVTEDGVREPQNRRVEVIVEPMKRD